MALRVHKLDDFSSIFTTHIDMFPSVSSILIASLFAGHASALNARQAKPISIDFPAAAAAPIPAPIIVSFPAIGPILEITGNLEFHSVATGVEIISSETDGLRNFPAGLGPFLYHGIVPSPRIFN
jgi:hypothetical protein